MAQFYDWCGENLSFGTRKDAQIIDSRVASFWQALSASSMNFCLCELDQFSSSVNPHSVIAACTRHSDTLCNNHGAFASSLRSASSTRYLKNTPAATSYAQKKRFLNVIPLVAVISYTLADWEDSGSWLGGPPTFSNNGDNTTV